MAHIVGVPKREPCRKCALPVFLAERINVGKNIYHRTCLKCARCKSQLSLGSFYETEIDGEFCCETCPDEESNTNSSSPTATLNANQSKTIGIDENESPNKSVVGLRSSIADRLAFFERSSKDGNQLLQKSVSDEEKSKSLKKIAAKYKPNTALTNFMNNTLDDDDDILTDGNNLNIETDEISIEDNSKYDTTAESSDEDAPPALPKDGPPIDNTDDDDEDENDDDDDVLSVTIESHAKNNNAIINKDKQIANNNAVNNKSNSKVLLTSPLNKIINSTTTQINHNNHYHNNSNNINNNNNNNNDLNLSSNVTKDISNIQKNNNVQTGTTIIDNIKNDDTTTIITTDSNSHFEDDINITTTSFNVELRKKNELLQESPEIEQNSKESAAATVVDVTSNMKLNPTEERLSVVRARLQQFEVVSKSEEDINNSKKTTISISSFNKLNNIENSKLDDNSIIDIIEKKNKNDIVNLEEGNEVPNETKITTTESSIISKEESENDLKDNNLEKMKIDLKFEDIKFTNELKLDVNQEVDKDENKISSEIVADQMDTVTIDEEINIEEQIKLSEDDKQTAVIKKTNKINEITLQTESEIISKNENNEINPVNVEVVEQIPQIDVNTQDDKTKFSSPEVISNENIQNKVNIMTTDMPQQETTTTTPTKVTLPTVRKTTTSDNKTKTKPVIKNEEINYPDELNPFASDDDNDDGNAENNKSDKKTDKSHSNSISNLKEIQDRRKSLNPFDSSDDEDNIENQEIKLKPPRPPPPKISKNPFGSESEEEDDNTGSGNASLVSMGSTKRAPVPTPRGQLTPSSRNNLTPEPTPRSVRQCYSAGHRLENSNEYYGSNISLNSSITSPNGKDSFSRYHDTRSSNNSLASSAGGSSGINTMRTRKKKAPAPPPPPTSLAGATPKTPKELFPTNDVDSKKSTPGSSCSTTPQMSRKKRPAPKPPIGLTTTTPKKDENSKSSENVPQLSDLPSSDQQNVTEVESVSKDYLSDNKTEAIQNVEMEKLSDEEKVAHLDGRQFFLAATSTSSKVSENLKKEETSLIQNSAPIVEKSSMIIESNEMEKQKTGGVECSKAIIDKSIINSDNLVLDSKNEIYDTSNDTYITIINSQHISTLDPLDSLTDEVSHDRHIEKIKDNKESKNRNRQSQHYNDDINDPLLNKSIHGKWKRRKGPAPSLPVPPRKILQMLPLQEIRHELEIIEVQQQGLEKQGVILETMIRERCEGKNGELINEAGNLDEKTPNSKEVEDLILQLFELVNEKNELFRRQAELMYLRRQHRLEQEQADLEYEIRLSMAQPERNKTDSDKAREEALIARLVEVVQLRNEVIECLEMDRLREAEEDLSIKQRLEMHTAKRDEELAKQTPTKLSKKEKKKQKEAKKLGKSKKIDADKDADESEINVETQKKKKKRKFLFSVLTASSKSD